MLKREYILILSYLMHITILLFNKMDKYTFCSFDISYIIIIIFDILKVQNIYLSILLYNNIFTYIRFRRIKIYSPFSISIIINNDFYNNNVYIINNIFKFYY